MVNTISCMRVPICFKETIYVGLLVRLLHIHNLTVYYALTYTGSEYCGQKSPEKNFQS